jgi:hypothetical protein
MHIRRLKGISLRPPSMDCPEFLRLRQNYDSALRRWSQMMLTPAGDSGYTEAKRKAYEERDEARHERDLHLAQCRICNGDPRSMHAHDRAADSLPG